MIIIGESVAISLIDSGQLYHRLRSRARAFLHLGSHVSKLDWAQMASEISEQSNRYGMKIYS